MRQICFIFVSLFFFSLLDAQVYIEEVSLMNRLHYRISTANAIYYIDRYSGGISQLFDNNGNDWVDWKRLESEKYPESAAGDYRGIPNLVYGEEDNGIGHPGFDKCMSFKEGVNRVRIRSMNGKWEFLYVFYPKYAELQIVKMPENSRNYWFLYEGVPGGSFLPEKTYWGTNNGLKTSKPDYFKGEEEYGDWQWVFFGNEDQEGSLFFVQKGKDNVKDVFGFLGNSDSGINSKDGMVVFGFGRGEEATPLISRTNIFYFGFYHKKIDDKTFKRFSNYINKTFFY